MTKRILVVDDERSIADSLATILRQSGYSADAFYNADRALSECENITPDLVISDVVMPGMDGVEMAIHIKQRYPNCKILLFSGMAATADLLEQARSQGYEFEVLQKPVHPADLLSRLVA